MSETHIVIARHTSPSDYWDLKPNCPVTVTSDTEQRWRACYNLGRVVSLSVTGLSDKL